MKKIGKVFAIDIYIIFYLCNVSIAQETINDPICQESIYLINSNNYPEAIFKLNKALDDEHEEVLGANFHLLLAKCYLELDSPSNAFHNLAKCKIYT